MKKSIKNSGMTLVEIIVALAILGIMAASFLFVFFSGYTTIFSMGKKTEAVNEKAQVYMDMLYEDYDSGMIAITSDPAVTVSSTSYSALDLVTVTITVSYSTSKTISLTSVVPKGDD